MNIVMKKWPEILDLVKKELELSDVSFDTWLKPLKIHSVENEVVTIIVQSKEFIKYIEKKFQLHIKVAITELSGLDCEIKFITPDNIPSVSTVQDTKQASNYANTNLNPKYTFDTFVVGKNNNFAHAASLAVAESPGEIYNPLFLYGGVGLGKTHLMHSIAHFILDNDPSKKILYVTSEEFTHEVIDSIRNGNNAAMAKFRDKYRNIDVLLVDDIQFIIGKEATQEEFFHTFNALHGAGKQIIISSDKPPKDMDILEDRIRSRFEWGLIADISLPDYETRMAILRKKEELDGYDLDDSIIEYIATNIKSNIRELEGSLNKIIAFSNLEKKEVTLELAEQVLKDIISPNETKIITPENIINVVSEHFDVTPENIKSSKRSEKITRPRQIVMYLLREMADYKYQQIAQILGKKDHTTIMSGVKKIEKDLKDSPDLQNTINVLKKKLNSPS